MLCKRLQMSRDYPKDQGAAAIGARLRRLSERLDREADALYKELGVEFQQRWFGVVNQLALHGPMSVGDLAEVLGVTHAAVSQTRSALQARRLVASSGDPEDARKTLIALTGAGRRLVTQLAPAWSALVETARDLNREAGDAIKALDALERALSGESVLDRVRGKLARAKTRSNA
jgi:DNA-binding MarR family transcriptional regulator